jgi:ribonuclease HII
LAVLPADALASLPALGSVCRTSWPVARSSRNCCKARPPTSLADALAAQLDDPQAAEQQAAFAAIHEALRADTSAAIVEAVASLLDRRPMPREGLDRRRGERGGSGPLAGPLHAAAVVLGDGFDVVGISRLQTTARRPPRGARPRPQRGAAVTMRMATVGDRPPEHPAGHPAGDDAAPSMALRLKPHRVSWSTATAAPALRRCPGARRWCAGDATVAAISAASILAKARARSPVMRELHASHPPGTASAATPATRRRLSTWRRCAGAARARQHRRSYAPVASLLVWSPDAAVAATRPISST